MSTASPTASTSSAPSQAHPTSDRAVAEARAALEASMHNIGSSLDSQLKSRAANLHANNVAVDKQISELQAATLALAKDTDKLKKVADDAARKLKELGNVQNWAEVMEREFMILEETVRLAAESGSEEEEDYGPCRVCGKRVEEDGDELLWCRGCDGEFHKECVGFESVPLGEWHCAECEQQGTYLQPVGDAGTGDPGQGSESKDEDVQMGGMEVEKKGKAKEEKGHSVEPAPATTLHGEADDRSTSSNMAGDESSLNHSSTSNTTGEDNSLHHSSMSGGD